MKNLVISTLSIISLSTLFAPAFASEIAATNRKTVNHINQISPFDLVTGSYQGRFTNQGIPAFDSFLSAIQNNRIDAEDLVQSAIATGRLSEDTLNDTQYLNSVDSLLESVDTN